MLLRSLYPRFITLLLLGCFLTCARPALACQCPGSTLSRVEAEKYELIFRGKILSVKPCEGEKSEAVFEVNELYRGNTTSHFTILFNCKDECKVEFRVGDEWIIYTKYYQMENAKMDWCSRSRKFFKNAGEDFYTVNYGNSYEEELSFLQTKLGLHKLLKDNPDRADKRNVIPSRTQFVVTLLISLAAVVLFIWLFNRFFK